jgi:hypothetical protein
MHQSQSPLRATLAPAGHYPPASAYRGAILDPDPGPVADLDDPAYLAAAAAEDPNPSAPERAYIAWATSEAPTTTREQ